VTDKVWKQIERRVASVFNEIYSKARRNPLSGIVDRQTHGDVTDTPFYIEIKHRARIPFLSDFKEAASHAREEHKPLLLVVHEKGSHRCLVTLELKDLLDILRIGQTWREQAQPWIIENGKYRRKSP